MGIDFVRSRESHLTITHDAVYRKLYKVVEADAFDKGERVLVELTNGMYEHCIVVSTDPLNLAPYEKKHYVREDQMYRGTFIPEYLRKDAVSPNAAEGGSLDGSGSSSSSDDGSGTEEDTGDNNEQVNDDNVDDNGSNDGYIPCECNDDCPCRENCGSSMLGHLGYDHIYCHCHEEPDDDEDTSDSSGSDGDGGSGEDGDSSSSEDSQETPQTRPVRPQDLPCFCETCHKPCLSDCPYAKVLFDLEVPETIHPDEEFIDCIVRLAHPAERKIAVFIDAEDTTGVMHQMITFDAGETESSFQKLFCGSDTTFTANCEGHTVTKVTRMEGFPVVFESLECETHPIKTNKPLTLRLTLHHPVSGTEIVSLSANHPMVLPDKLVFVDGEQTKTFMAVILEKENLIMANYGSLEITCVLNEEEIVVPLPEPVIVSLHTTDDLVVGEMFTLHITLDRDTDAAGTLSIEFSDDTLVLMPSTVDVSAGTHEISVTGIFTREGTETFTVTFGASTKTLDATC